MSAIDIFLEIFVMACSLLILAMTLTAYRLAKNSKLLLISGAFVLFFLRGLFLLLDNFLDIFDNISLNSYWLAFDFFILLLIYFAIIKK